MEFVDKMIEKADKSRIFAAGGQHWIRIRFKAVCDFFFAV